MIATNRHKDRAAQAVNNRIAFIQACWHKQLVDRCRDAFIQAMTAAKIDSIDVIEVPGSFEIPLQAKRAARSGRYDAIVAAGLVIDGGIYAHQFVADAVLNGLMQVQLETDTPILSVVLSPHHFHEIDAHQGFFHGHLMKKGDEAAAACLQVLALRPG